MRTEPTNLIRPGLAGWATLAKPGESAATTWAVEGGVLRCTGKPTGALVSEASHADYRLIVEYRYTEPAAVKRPNSGILIHCQPGKLVWPHGYEVQLAANDAGDLWKQPDAAGAFPGWEIDAARADAKNPVRRAVRSVAGKMAEKPAGEWNRVVVECRGDSVGVELNGAAANAAQKLALKTGRVGLQAEGAAVEFRLLTLEMLG